MVFTDRVVLFDLDGTLIDTAPEMHLSMNALLEDEGLDPLPYKSIRPHVSNGVMGIFNNAFNDNPKMGGRRFIRYLDIYEESDVKKLNYYQELSVCIKFIKI